MCNQYFFTPTSSTYSASMHCNGVKQVSVFVCFLCTDSYSMARYRAHKGQETSHVEESERDSCRVMVPRRFTGRLINITNIFAPLLV